MKYRYFEGRQDVFVLRLDQIVNLLCISFQILKLYIESRDKIKAMRLPPSGQCNLELKSSSIIVKLRLFEISYFITGCGSFSLVCMVMLIKIEGLAICFLNCF